MIIHCSNIYCAPECATERSISPASYSYSPYTSQAFCSQTAHITLRFYIFFAFLERVIDSVSWKYVCHQFDLKTDSMNETVFITITLCLFWPTERTACHSSPIPLFCHLRFKYPISSVGLHHSMVQQPVKIHKTGTVPLFYFIEFNSGYFKGAMCKKWSRFKYTLQANRSQHITGVTASCCFLWPSLAR